MSKPNDNDGGRSFGQITILPDPSPPWLKDAGRPPPKVTSSIYEWTPAPDVAAELPPGFSIRLRCVKGEDGVRRFYPVEQFDEFIPRASAAGLALLTALKRLRPEQLHSYRVMSFLRQRVRRTRENLGNRLLDSSSLRVSRVGSDLAGDSILPESLGQDAQGVGDPWRLDRLLSEGEQAAREAGLARPSEADRIRHGLAAAARVNPLTLPADRVPDLVRQALYEEIEPDEPLEPEALNIVVERTLAAMERHLEDPSAAFDAWFWGGNNSLIGQIARRKLPRGGRLDPRVVRKALAELGWQGYRYDADCVHTVMWAIENSMPEPLSEAERMRFERAYLSQAAFGGLPLILLHERIAFILPILSEILDDPDNNQAVLVLYRLLDWYGDMARRRRRVDRTVKQRRPERPRDGERTPLTVPLPSVVADEAGETDDDWEDAADEPAAPTVPADLELFMQIADLICERRGLSCRCGLRDWIHRPVAFAGGVVTIDHTCRACQSTVTSTVPAEEFRRAARGDAN